MGTRKPDATRCTVFALGAGALLLAGPVALGDGLTMLPGSTRKAPSSTIETYLGDVRSLLERSKRHQPFYAVYEANLPPAPAMEAGRWKKTVIVDAGNVSCADFRPDDSVFLMAEAGLLRVRYAETGGQRFLFESRLKSPVGDPLRWLAAEAYPDDDFVKLDSALLGYLSRTVSAGRVVAERRIGSSREVQVATPEGTAYTLAVGASGFSLQGGQAGSPRPELLLRYRSGTIWPRGVPDPRTAMRDTFRSAPNQGVKRFGPGAHYTDMLASIAPNLLQATLSPEDAKRLAARERYWWPASPGVRVAGATVVYGTMLTITVASSARSYDLMQQRYSASDIAALKGSAVSSRRVDGWTVMLEQEPGYGTQPALSVYYVHGATVLRCDAPYLDPVRDGVVQTFRPAQ